MEDGAKLSELTIDQIESTSSLDKKVPVPKKSLPNTDMLPKFLILEGWSHWFFRLGFASIFFVTAVSAALEPESFTGMLRDNLVAGPIGYHDIMVKIAMVNDLLLTVLIIGGWRKRLTYAWAGIWLILVAGLKLMNLFI